MITRTARLIMFLLGSGLGLAIYTFTAARNKGGVPHWAENLAFTAWGTMVVIVAILIFRSLERNRLNLGLNQETVIEPAESRIFGAMFLYVALYRDARELELAKKWAAWFRDPPPAYGEPLVRVELTSDHFVVQSVTGRTWRAIPVSKIRRVYRRSERSLLRGVNVLAIEYEHASRREALVIPEASRRSFELEGLLSRQIHDRPHGRPENE